MVGDFYTTLVSHSKRVIDSSPATNRTRALYEKVSYGGYGCSKCLFPWIKRCINCTSAKLKHCTMALYRTKNKTISTYFMNYNQRCLSVFDLTNYNNSRHSLLKEDFAVQVLCYLKHSIYDTVHQLHSGTTRRTEEIHA